MGWIQFGTFEFIKPDYKKVRIIQPFIYEYFDGRRFQTAINQISDGASIPDSLESFAGGNYGGGYIPAAFIHDELCQKGLTGEAVCSWADAHKIFYHAMLDNGCKKWGLKGAWVKYQAVKIGMFFRRWKYKG